MDDFKSFLRDKRTPQKKTKLVESEELDLKIDISKDDMIEEHTVIVETPKPKKKAKDIISSAQKFLSEDSHIPTFQDMPSTGYIGAFNYVPEPSMFAEGAEYRNKNNGTVYKKVGNLWEEYVRDGKNGAQGMSVGGGCGVNEVKSLISRQAAGKLFVLEGATATSVSASVSDLKSFDASYDFNIVGLKVEGPSTETYSAVVRFYTYENSTFKLAATSVITNTNNIDGILILSENKQWCADIQITNGTVPAPGITAKVVL